MSEGLVTVKHPIILDANEETKRAILNLLSSQYEENEAEGALHMRDLARKHPNFVVNNGFVELLIKHMVSGNMPTRIMCCSAISVLARDVAIREQLVNNVLLHEQLLDVLAEGFESKAAEAAALVVMNLAMSPTYKAAAAKNGILPALLDLLNQALPRNYKPSSPGIRRPPASRSLASAAASGALMTLMMHKPTQVALQNSDALDIVGAIATSEGEHTLTHRCKFMKGWLELEPWEDPLTVTRETLEALEPPPRGNGIGRTATHAPGSLSRAPTNGSNHLSRSPTHAGLQKSPSRSSRLHGALSSGSNGRLTGGASATPSPRSLAAV